MIRMLHVCTRRAHGNCRNHLRSEVSKATTDPCRLSEARASRICSRSDSHEHFFSNTPTGHCCDARRFTAAMYTVAYMSPSDKLLSAITADEQGSSPAVLQLGRSISMGYGA